jgi:hypothetical protein
LPITCGWMMGYPPGWLATALISAMANGSLLPASSSRRSATPSFRKSPKPLAEPFLRTERALAEIYGREAA